MSDEADKGRKAFFWKLIGAIGMSGLVLASTVIFAIRDAVKKTDVLSCENRIAFAEKQRDNDWTLCMILGGEIRECRETVKDK